MTTYSYSDNTAYLISIYVWEKNLRKKHQRIKLVAVLVKLTAKTWLKSFYKIKLGIIANLLSSLHFPNLSTNR